MGLKIAGAVLLALFVQAPAEDACPADGCPDAIHEDTSLLGLRSAAVAPHVAFAGKAGSVLNPLLPGSATVRCGRGWDGAAGQCGTPCSNPGSSSGCPAGESCSGGLNACNPTTPLQAGAAATVRCGANWDAANSKCGTPCSNPGADSGTNCPAGERCFGGLKECNPVVVVPTSAPPPPKALYAYCGKDFVDASTRCGVSCWSGTGYLACPVGERCFALSGPCTPQDLTVPRCGRNKADANSRCGTLCPTGDGSYCPYGEYCFAHLAQQPCAAPTCTQQYEDCSGGQQCCAPFTCRLFATPGGTRAFCDEP